MKRAIGTALGLLACRATKAYAAAATGDDTLAIYKAAVVGFNVTFQRWDEDRPWAKLTPQTRRVAAIMVGPHRFLTTADAVDNATFMQLTTGGPPPKRLHQTGR